MPDIAAHGFSTSLYVREKMMTSIATRPQILTNQTLRRFGQEIK
jgi:hypothetical protein